MKPSAVSICGAAMLAALAGCGAAHTVANVLVSDTVTVILRNTSDDYDVEVTLYYGDDQDVLESILTDIGQRRDYTIAPGQSVTFTEECDDLQAIIIEDADLNVIVGIGPETNTEVLRDGDDFNCHDTLTFTFAYTDALVDFDVTFTHQ